MCDATIRNLSVCMLGRLGYLGAQQQNICICYRYSGKALKKMAEIMGTILVMVSKKIRLRSSMLNLRKTLYDKLTSYHGD